MFENYREMSPEEQEKVKQLHKAVRGCHRYGDRYRIVAWGFVRGLPYRRVERSHRVQSVHGVPFEHNMPIACVVADVLRITGVFSRGADGFMGHAHRRNQDAQIEAWLANPDGAIPAPPPRAKKAWSPAQVEDPYGEDRAARASAVKREAAE